MRAPLAPAGVLRGSSAEFVPPRAPPHPRPGARALSDRVGGSRSSGRERAGRRSRRPPQVSPPQGDLRRFVSLARERATGAGGKTRVRLLGVSRGLGRSRARLGPVEGDGRGREGSSNLRQAEPRRSPRARSSMSIRSRSGAVRTPWRAAPPSAGGHRRRRRASTEIPRRGRIRDHMPCVSDSVAERMRVAGAFGNSRPGSARRSGSVRPMPDPML